VTASAAFATDAPSGLVPIGPATAALCELILEHRPHPEQGFRACLGIVRPSYQEVPKVC
jgi:hypothetical protein